VLELGCGVGLAGIAAAALGGRVVLTDRDVDVLDRVLRPPCKQTPALQANVAWECLRETPDTHPTWTPSILIGANTLCA
jgi:predicted RNA methylase